MSKKEKGFTLIELIIFIVVIGIIGTGIVMAFQVASARSPILRYTARAAELAEARMEAIVGQARMIGFSSFTDPCVSTPSLPVCVSATGFTISSTISSSWGGSSDFKQITVTVSGLGNATLTTLIAKI